jgi:hypothetical protein
MLLCNLAYEKNMLSLLKRSRFPEIEQKLELTKDLGIKFAHHILSAILIEDEIDVEYEPIKLKQDYAEFLQDNTSEAIQHVKSNVIKADESE